MTAMVTAALALPWLLCASGLAWWVALHAATGGLR